MDMSAIWGKFGGWREDERLGGEMGGEGKEGGGKGGRGERGRRGRGVGAGKGRRREGGGWEWSGQMWGASHNLATMGIDIYVYICRWVFPVTIVEMAICLAKGWGEV